MPDLPAKLRLTPEEIKRHREWAANHPDNRLSPEAKKRINKAYDDQYIARLKTRAAVELRWRAEANDVDLDDYESKGQAFIDLVEADIAAARLVLQTKAEEYWKLGLEKRFFRDVMEQEVEGATYSLRLGGHQKLLLDTEFGYLWKPPEIGSQSLAGVGEPPPSHVNSATPAERVRSFMEDKSIDVATFARMIGKSVRTVASVLADESVGKDTRSQVAKALGTTPEELFKSSASS